MVIYADLDVLAERQVFKTKDNVVIIFEDKRVVLLEGDLLEGKVDVELFDELVVLKVLLALCVALVGEGVLLAEDGSGDMRRGPRGGRGVDAASWRGKSRGNVSLPDAAGEEELAVVVDLDAGIAAALPVKVWHRVEDDLVELEGHRIGDAAVEDEDVVKVAQVAAESDGDPGDVLGGAVEDKVLEALVGRVEELGVAEEAGDDKARSGAAVLALDNGDVAAVDGEPGGEGATHIEDALEGGREGATQGKVDDLVVKGGAVVVDVGRAEVPDKVPPVVSCG